jgi:hypothetical protein
MIKFAYNSLLALIGLILCGLPQTGYSQSVYSALGIGEIQGKPEARLDGMGGAGTALRDSLILIIENPAMPASVNQTRFSISGGYYWLDIKDDATSDIRDYADFKGFDLAIPVYGHWTVSAGVGPYSIARAEWFFSRQFENLGYEEQYKVSGGISRILVGLGIPLNDRLQIGGGVRALFGTVDQTLTINIISTSYRDAQYVNRLNVKSIGATAGAVWEFIPGWSIGGYYYSSQHGNGELDFSYLDSDSIRTTNGTIDFPASVGIGASAMVRPRVRLVGDVLWTQWKDADISIGQQLNLADTWKIMAGAEIQPLFGGLESFANRLYYRIGFSTENLYVENQNGETPRQTMVYAGLGIPLQGGQRRLDVAFQWGIRGNIGEFGAKETVVGLSLTFESSEKWFVRHK